VVLSTSPGVQIAARSRHDAAIERAPTGITAFVGRALKGPINQPVSIASFGEYQKHFGGLWQPSTLSYAVEQFFENGGREAIVVRVVNGGRPPSLTLRAGSDAEALHLVGLVPGSRDHLRASVDYDGIGPADAGRFNLVVQRVSGPGSELVEVQESFRRISVHPGEARYVVDALASSSLVRVAGPVPTLRPDLPPPKHAGATVGYVLASNDGDDGVPLTDYDLIGSVQRSTGLFALQSVPLFNLLCIPPLGREQDVGASTLLVAARFCRERQAMLVVDPPREWRQATDALDAAQRWPFRADNALMYFPRITALDRLRGRQEVFAGCGAVAGMLVRLDAATPPWSRAGHDEVLLRPVLRPACAVSEVERSRLLQLGINTLSPLRVAQHEGGAARTLATGNSIATDWRYLAARRTAQFVALSVRQGTAWMALATNGPETWRRAREQVSDFLGALDAQGAFPSRPGEGYFVVCDERLNRPDAQAAGRIALLFGFAASRPGEFHSFIVTHGAAASEVRAVSVNRYATSGRRVDEEIEAALLRGLTRD
jgi:hypothetical protein